jgi:hypothetical protein
MINTGNLEGIVGIVSSYWDADLPAGHPANASHSLLSHLERGPDNSDRVGFLDPSRGFSSSVFSPPKALVRISVLPAASSSRSQGHSTAVEAQVTGRPSQLPNVVKLISHSDAIPRPEVPAPAPPALPNLSESPLVSLIAAASMGNLDLQHLESFDNATLESIVPRDPASGRPLTIGSIEHSNVNCRPCIFYLKAKCFKGIRCNFCHFNHTTLRKQVPVNVATKQSSTGAVKSKRLRPSKRTREMIKQINEQMLFEDIHDDPTGPALSANQPVLQFQPPTVQAFL